MMFMRPSNKKYGGPDFQIAKGKLEDGEDFRTASLREANEELGLKQSNVIELTDMGLFMGRTNIYVAKIADPTNFEHTTTETDAVTWLTYKQFINQGRALHKHVVRHCHEFMKEAEEL